MFCPECGAEVSSEDTLCPSCKKQLVQHHDSNTDTNTDTNSNTDTVTATSAAVMQKKARVTPPPPVGKAIAALILGIAAAFVSLIFLPLPVVNTVVNVICPVASVILAAVAISLSFGFKKRNRCQGYAAAKTARLLSVLSIIVAIVRLAFAFLGAVLTLLWSLLSVVFSAIAGFLSTVLVPLLTTLMTTVIPAILTFLTVLLPFLFQSSGS